MDNEKRPEKQKECEGDFVGRTCGEEHPGEGEKHDGHDSACISIVHQNVCVEAIVTIKPLIKVGEGASVHCGHCEIKKLEDHHHQHNQHHHHPPHHPRHHKEPTPEIIGKWHLDSKHRTPREEDECSFIVTQELCLMIPLVFSAEAIVKSEKIHCENPDTRSCSCDCDDKDSI